MQLLEKIKDELNVTEDAIVVDHLTQATHQVTADALNLRSQPKVTQTNKIGLLSQGDKLNS